MVQHSVVSFKQSQYEAYVSAISFKNVKWFLDREPKKDNLERAQRKLNERRVPKITKYITESSQYVLPPVVLTLTKCVEENGVLTIPDDTEVYVSDGQHRLNAVKDLDIDEQIPVMFLKYKGIDSCKQTFTDLNMNLVKPTKSLSLFYDTKNEFSNMLVDKVFRLSDIELEDINVKGKSDKKYAMSQMYKAMSLIGKNRDIDDYKNFYNYIMEKWEIESTKYEFLDEFRKLNLFGYGVMLEIIAIVYANLLDADRETSISRLKDGLAVVEFTKDDVMWKDIVIDGLVVKNGKNVLRASLSILTRFQSK